MLACSRRQAFCIRNHRYLMDAEGRVRASEIIGAGWPRCVFLKDQMIVHSAALGVPSCKSGRRRLRRIASLDCSECGAEISKPCMNVEDPQTKQIVC